MITGQVIQQPKREFIVRCELCHNEAKFKPIIKRLGTKFGVICKDCVEKFSESEIELLSNLFLAFGGYFNKFHSSKEIQHQIIKEVAEKCSQQRKDGFKLENDAISIHKGLLYGITLTQLVHGVKDLLS